MPGDWHIYFVNEHIVAASVSSVHGAILFISSRETALRTFLRFICGVLTVYSRSLLIVISLTKNNPEKTMTISTINLLTAVRASLLVSLLTITGCSSVTVTEGSLVHMINASQEGDVHALKEGETYTHFVPGLTGTNETPTWSTTSDNYQDYLERILENIRLFRQNQKDQSKPTKVMIFVHGGLNTLENSIERAIDQYPTIKEDNVYPVFINWRSGPLTSYGDHLFRVRDGEVDKVHGGLTAAGYLATDVLGIISEAPEAWVEQGVDSYSDTLLRNDRKELKPVMLGTELKVLHSENSNRSLLDSTLKGTGWAVTALPKIFTTPFLYSFGKPAWDIMNRRAHELLIRSCEFYDDERSCNRSSQMGSQPDELLRLNNAESITELKNSPVLACQYDANKPICSGPFSVFLKKLRGISNNENNSSEYKYKFNLIGHSMGAIVISEVLQFFPDLKFDNIVFMGAAVNSRNALKGLVPYLQRHAESNFYNLSLHPHAEDTESNWFGVLPNGSLLTWIDSMYSLPENENDKTFGQWINARQIARHIPADVANRFHFRIFGFGKDEPQEHGSFENIENAYWNEQFWGVGSYQPQQ